MCWPMWLSSSGPAWSWAAALGLGSCGYASGRTCLASAATSRPRAAATRPPLEALRRTRVAYAIRQRRGDTLPLDAWGRPEDDQAVIVVASWHYLGSGYQSTREAWLAALAAARAREARRIAKEELRTMTMTAA
jgi:hypothetical protein